MGRRRNRVKEAFPQHTAIRRRRLPFGSGDRDWKEAGKGGYRFLPRRYPEFSWQEETIPEEEEKWELFFVPWRLSLLFEYLSGLSIFRGERNWHRASAENGPLERWRILCAGVD